MSAQAYPHTITIQWYSDADKAWIYTYRFATREELNKFMAGVAECAERLPCAGTFKVLKDSRETAMEKGYFDAG